MLPMRQLWLVRWQRHSHMLDPLVVVQLLPQRKLPRKVLKREISVL